MAINNRPDKNADRLANSLKRAVNNSRQLTFALTSVSGQLGGAVNLASSLAENIAKASKATRNFAGGIGLAVAAIGTVISLVKGFSDQNKEVARTLGEINRQTAIIAARGLGDERLAQQLEIADAAEREAQQMKSIESFLRKFPELYAAVKRQAVVAGIALDQTRDRAFADRFADLDQGPLAFGDERRRREIEGRAEIARMESDEARRIDRNAEGFSPEQVSALRQRLAQNIAKATLDLNFELQAPIRDMGDQLGMSFADALANGIQAGIQGGSVERGFRALSGSLLIGLGGVMQEIGVQGLLAQRLMDGLIAGLSSFVIGGGIPAALALIGAGGVLKGLGASMGGRGRGSASAGAASGGYGGGAATQIVDRGLVNPLNPLATPYGSVAAMAPTQHHWTVIGENDPVAQRSIMNIVDKAGARRG